MLQKMLTSSSQLLITILYNYFDNPNKIIFKSVSKFLYSDKTIFSL